MFPRYSLLFNKIGITYRNHCKLFRSKVGIKLILINITEKIKTFC
jgi:hypothetical protein